MKILNETIIDNGDASGDLTSDAVLLDFHLGYCVSATVTTSGSIGGSLALQGAVDFGGSSPSQSVNATDVADWVDIAGSTQTITGAGVVTWNVEGAYYKWVRLVYTSTSGTGNITAKINAKGF